jgi:hypothetical protein
VTPSLWISSYRGIRFHRRGGEEEDGSGGRAQRRNPPPCCWAVAAVTKLVFGDVGPGEGGRPPLAIEEEEGALAGGWHIVRRKNGRAHAFPLSHDRGSF